jgi:hypothetical protein
MDPSGQGSPALGDRPRGPDSGFSREGRVLYLALLALMVCLIGGIVLGVRVMGPFLAHELGRLEPAEALVLWSGDAVALLAFSYYCVRHVLLEIPIQDAELPPGGLDRRFRVVMIGMVSAFVVDLGYTLYLMDQESRAFAVASRAEATVFRVRSRQFPFGTVYALDGRFVDLRGVVRKATFVLKDDRKYGLPFLIPPKVQGAIRRGQVPFNVGVAYDPDRPARRWLLGSRWFDEDRLHVFSLVVMSVQLLGIGYFAIALRATIERRGRLPWWHDLHTVIPLTIEVAAVVFISLVELIHGRLTWWLVG